MKLRKLLAGVLSAAMVIGSMVMPAFADTDYGNIQATNVGVEFTDDSHGSICGMLTIGGFNNVTFEPNAFKAELYHDDLKLMESYRDDDELKNTTGMTIKFILTPPTDGDVPNWITTIYDEALVLENVPNKAKIYDNGVLIAELSVDCTSGKYAWSQIAYVAKVNNNYYRSLPDAVTAAEDGETVTVLSDIDVTKEILLDAGSDKVTIDFNNKKVTRKGTNQDHTFLIKGDITIENGNFDTKNSGASCLTCGRSKDADNTYVGSLTINSGTYYGDYTSVYTINGTTTINGGYYEVEPHDPYSYNLTINCLDASYNNDSAKVVINGGTFYKWNPFNNAAEGADTDFLSDNSMVAKYTQDGTFEAMSNDEVGAIVTTADNEVYGYRTLAEAKNNAGDGDTVSGFEAETVNVVLDDVTKADAEGEKVYALYLVGENSTINRLTSGQFTFALTSSDDMKYTIVTESDVTATPNYNGNKNEYLLNFNGKNTPSATAHKIKLAEVKVTGYGTFDFAVTAGQAHATTTKDNIVTDYVVTPNENQGTLVIGNDAKVENVTIAVPKRTLTINVDFPNAIKDNSADYQDMTVTISGNNETFNFPLGGNMTDGKYVVTTDLVYNTPYTVTVKGAGYRTATHMVTMNTDKTLNFWNNVKSVEEEVEVDLVSSKETVTFLAGELVNDGKINVYDLSAVVSYFGSQATVDNGYAKYDLDRNGKVDSKDVAFVLASWGN